MRKLKLNKLREKAFKYFSIYKRQLGMDKNGYNECVTCNVKIHWKDANAGHYIHGHTKPTYLEPNNVHIQCPKCNLYLNGNLVAYSMFMEATYGMEEIRTLWQLSHKVIKFDRSYYEAIIQKYKDMVGG